MHKENIVPKIAFHESAVSPSSLQLMHQHPEISAQTNGLPLSLPESRRSCPYIYTRVQVMNSDFSENIIIVRSVIVCAF